MRLNVSAWSIRSPMPATVACLVLVVLGLFSFRNLPISRIPNIDIPIVQVAITQSGAAPGELESQVTKKVEDAVASVPDIWHIISTVTDGSSVTTIQFYVGSTNVDRALNSVKDQIAKIRPDLPRTINEPIVNRLDVEGLPIVTYAAASPRMSVEQLSWFVDDTVARALQSVKGVGSVTRSGGVDREIRIALDPKKLLSLGITAAAVNAQLRATNIDLAGGRGELVGQEQAIRTLAATRAVSDLAALSIALPGGRKVRLDELGTVTDGAAEARTFARLDGKPIVAFAISRAKGASDVGVDALVADKIAELRKQHPEVELTKIDTQVAATIGNYHSALETLAEGALLSVIVIFLFLRDLRATLISIIALPLSAIPTFWAMDLLGFSLNMVSLLAITLVTGILVDDTIVEIENIVRHMRMGKSAYRAALEAADEIGLAVIAISMTIVAVFMPVSFMAGIAGQYFRQFGMTVAIAVLFSLLVARFVTPIAAAYFLRAHDSPPPKDGPIMRFYTRLVRGSVRHRWITLALGLMLFMASIASTKLLPSGFIPADDLARTLLAVELPPGSRLKDTDRVTRDIAQRLKSRPEVKSVIVYGGQLLGGMGGAGEVRRATLVVNLVHKSERAMTQKELQKLIGLDLASVPDVRFWFLKDNGQRDISLIIAGNELDQIDEAANQLASEMRRIPIIDNPMSTAELDRPELQIIPKPQLAADLGVTTEAISETIRVATIGDIDANLAKFKAEDRLVPIRGRSFRRDAARRRARRDSDAADRQEPADRRRDQGVGRRRDHDRGDRRVRRRDGDRPRAGLRRAHSAVRLVRAAGDHPVLAAALDRRRRAGAACQSTADQHAGGDRHPHAYGHRHQERHHAGRLRGRGDLPRHITPRGAGRGRPQARPSDRDDHDRDGLRHAAGSLRVRRRRRVPLAHGDRGDRRACGIDRAVARFRSGGLHGAR